MNATGSGDILTSERVHDIFMDCLFREGEDTTNCIKAEGIIRDVGFAPERIDAHRQAIHDMLAELPDDFKASGGGGWSFLNACLDRHGRQWTGSHQVQEQLIQRGIAIGEVEYCLLRENWDFLPGSLPYFVVKQ